MLIAINRIWAVCHPISYRDIHSVRTAVALCIGMWVVVHVAVGPPVIIDTLYHRLSVEENGCMLNGPQQMAWEIVIEVIYWLPQCVMLTALPITFCEKRIRRGKMVKRHNMISPLGLGKPVYVVGNGE